MYTSSLQRLLTESRSRDLNHLAARLRGREPLTAPRPRRWRLRSARPAPVTRFAI